MLRPGKGTVHRAEILHDFANSDVLPVQLDGSLELELGHGKRQALKQLAGRLRDVIAIHRSFAVNREARAQLLRVRALRTSRGTNCGP